MLGNILPMTRKKKTGNKFVWSRSIQCRLFLLLAFNALTILGVLVRSSSSGLTTAVNLSLPARNIFELPDMSPSRRWYNW